MKIIDATVGGLVKSRRINTSLQTQLDNTEQQRKRLARQLHDSKRNEDVLKRRNEYLHKAGHDPMQQLQKLAVCSAAIAEQLSE